MGDECKLETMVHGGIRKSLNEIVETNYNQRCANMYFSGSILQKLILSDVMRPNTLGMIST